MSLDIEKAFYLVNDLFLITILGNYDFKNVLLNGQNIKLKIERAARESDQNLTYSF